MCLQEGLGAQLDTRCQPRHPCGHTHMGTLVLSTALGACGTCRMLRALSSSCPGTLGLDAPQARCQGGTGKGDGELCRGRVNSLLPL